MPEEPKQQSWWLTIAGTIAAIATALTAVIGLIVALRHEDPSKATPAILTVTPQPPPPPLRISGVWRDNWGIVSQLAQDGNTFKFTAEGPSCSGYFHSSGSGTIIGNSVQSSYQSDRGSQGNCLGTLLPDGATAKWKCTDNLCGTFESTAVRQ
jgi:hypothetical protein